MCVCAYGCNCVRARVLGVVTHVRFMTATQQQTWMLCQDLGRISLFLVAFRLHKQHTKWLSLFNLVILQPGSHPQSRPYSSGALVVAFLCHISRFDLRPTQPSNPDRGGNVAAEDP